jgi:hypothetical protein
MPEVSGGRRCDACEHVVHDLSAMTERDASRFVAERQGQRTCYRYLARPDGTILYAAEPARPGLAAAVALSLAACTPHGAPLELADPDVKEVTPALADPIVIPVAQEPAAVADEESAPCVTPEPTAAPDPKKQGKPPKKQVEYLGFE